MVRGLSLLVLLLSSSATFGNEIDGILGNILKDQAPVEGSSEEEPKRQVLEIPRPSAPEEPTPLQARPHRIAVLQCWDKITARTFMMKVPVGQEASFGKLKIHPQFCHKNPPGERPEAISFLNITETKVDGTLGQVFSGWLFASSPSVSAVEHPIYDVVVKDCEGPMVAEPETPTKP